MTPPFKNSFIVLWIVLFSILLIAYAFQHPQTRYILLNLVPMATAFGFMAAISGFGSIPVLIWMKERSIAIRFLTSLAFGIGFTGLVVVLAGFSGLLRKELFLGWIALGAVLFIFAVRKWSKNFSFSYQPRGWDALSLAALVLFLLPGLPFFVSPEVSRDATEYHLLIPAMWLRMEKIGFIPLFLESNYPPLAEFIYLVILPVAGEITCKCLHFVMAIAVMLLMGQFSKKLSPGSSPYFAPLMFISMPVVYVLAGWAWNDLFFTFFILLCAYFLVECHFEELETKRNSNFIFAGISLGLAACTKYTFVMYFPAIFILIFIGFFRWRWQWKNIASIVLPLGILSSYWIFKNWIFTGNPVYPFLNEIFHSPYWTENADHYFKATLNRYEIGTWSWSTYFLFPFLLTLQPKIIDVHTGVLPLVFAITLFRRSRSESETMLKYFVLISFLSWLIFQTIIRSLLPMLAIVFCLGSVAIQEMRWQSIWLRRLFMLLIAATISLNFFITMVTTQHLFEPFRYFIGLESKSQYLTRMSTAQPVYDELNRNKDVKQVLLVSLHNPFYLKRQALFSSCCDPPVAEVLTEGTSSSLAIADKMKRLGVSHIIIRKSAYIEENEKQLYSWNKKDRSQFEDFLNQHCIDINRYSDFILYRVK